MTPNICQLEIFRDVFASPRSRSSGATPTQGRQDEGEGSAWEKATEWSKNILDLSARPFAFGDAPASSHSTPKASTAHHTPANSAQTPLQGFSSLPKDYRAPTVHEVGPAGTAFPE